MKNNYDDIILKYLSDLLDVDERRNFESDLENNSILKERFEVVSKNLDDIKQLTPIESETSYFANLVPNVRDRIDSRTGKMISGSFQKAIGFGLAMVLVLIIVLQNGERSYDFNTDSVTLTLESANGEELNEFVEVRYRDLEHYDLLAEIDLENYSNAVYEQLAINDEELYDYIGYSYFGLDGINDITESEENVLYSGLIDKKIL